jgi:hypothetical protein
MGTMADNVFDAGATFAFQHRLRGWHSVNQRAQFGIVFLCDRQLVSAVCGSGYVRPSNETF